MNIAIDITATQSGHKMRGVGRYTQLLIESLQKTKTNHSFSFFTRGEKLSKDVDLVHYPYFDPFFLTLPLAKPVPCVVTVHDLIPLIFPDKFPKGIKGELKWFFQRLSLTGAKRIISDSDASKRDISTITGISEGKIDVVYLAPSPEFKPVRSLETLQLVRKKYSLPEKFLLYVGDVNWNKNIQGLLEAFSLVSNSDKNIFLILVGKPFLDTELTEIVDIDKRINELQVENFIKKLGFVSDEDLAAIYSLARAYIQPSFAEGFGFPVLEAMACGCPAIVSDATSLIEIAGPAKRVNPYKPAHIAQGILETLHVKDRNALEKLNVQWAKKFTWEKAAKETISVYEKTFEEK